LKSSLKCVIASYLFLSVCETESMFDPKARIWVHFDFREHWSSKNPVKPPISTSKLHQNSKPQA
jgi:hypothetical protein